MQDSTYGLFLAELFPYMSLGTKFSYFSILTLMQVLELKIITWWELRLHTYLLFFVRIFIGLSFLRIAFPWMISVSERIA
jgi:hypothetical protein